MKRALLENVEVNAENTDKRTWVRAMKCTKVDEALVLLSRHL